MYVIAMYIKYVCISIVAVDERDDITICEGGTVVFDCVLNTANTNISSDDVHWYRFIKNIGITEMINPNGTDIMFTTNHSGKVLTTTLTITNAVRSHTGYYWVQSPSDDTCNVSLTVGRSMWIKF